LDRIYIFHP
jgi:hypothetical protein